MFNIDNLQKLLIGVFGLVLIGAAIALGSKSGRAQYSETARTGFNVIMAVIIAAIGLGGIAYAAFGERILKFLGLSS